MRAAVLLVIFGLFAAAHAILPYELLKSEWDQFKFEHGKQYEDIEERYRFEIFTDNIETISKHNELYEAGEVSYEMGLNEYSDMSYQEFLEQMGYNDTLDELFDSEFSDVTFIPPENLAEPDTIDWHSKGAVTGVKNQRRCGSCWAFATTGTLEGQHFRKTGQLVSLSEQNLVDCSLNNHGCRGGNAGVALTYIKYNGGIDTEDAYEYTAQDGICNFKRDKIGATVKNVIRVRSGDEKMLKKAVASVGPIAVSIILPPSFQHYRSGVYSEANCFRQRNTYSHAVLITGYGTLDNKDYWLVKNSWGESWGDRGYIKMSRNMNNQCGIANRPVFPIV